MRYSSMEIDKNDSFSYVFTCGGLGGRTETVSPPCFRILTCFNIRGGKGSGLPSINPLLLILLFFLLTPSSSFVNCKEDPDRMLKNHLSIMFSVPPYLYVYMHVCYVVC